MAKTATIAFDIDGTLVDNEVQLSTNTQYFLNALHKKGHHVLFVTGRTYHFAKKTLKPLAFPYILGVQNGAELLSMPDHRLYHQELVPKDVIFSVDKAMQGISGDFLVYAGYEKGDFCYFRPHKFTHEQLEYIAVLKTLTPVNWIALESFEDIPQDSFPLIKCLGTKEAMQRCYEKLEGNTQIKACLVDDRMSDLTFLLITKINATKGGALEKLLALQAIKRPIIVAGDAMNDISMFFISDIAIAMQDGAKALKEKADIIAPPASKEGVIKGVDEALSRLKAL